MSGKISRIPACAEFLREMANPGGGGEKLIDDDELRLITGLAAAGRLGLPEDV